MTETVGKRMKGIGMWADGCVRLCRVVPSLYASFGEINELTNFESGRGSPLRCFFVSVESKGKRGDVSLLE